MVHDEPLLKPAEVAEFLGIGRATIYRLAGDEIPCVEVGGNLRFLPSDVRRYVEEHTVRRASTRAQKLLGPM